MSSLPSLSQSPSGSIFENTSQPLLKLVYELNSPWPSSPCAQNRYVCPSWRAEVGRTAVVSLGTESWNVKPAGTYADFVVFHLSQPNQARIALPSLSGNVARRFGLVVAT